jgi:hypothetical protein
MLHKHIKLLIGQKKFINNMWDVHLHVHYHCLLADNRYPKSFLFLFLFLFSFVFFRSQDSQYPNGFKKSRI